MTRNILGATALLLGSTSMGHALGLDRSGQDIGFLFEPEGYAQLSLGFARPNLEGTDVSGNEIEDVGEDFSIVSGAVKYDITPQVSLGLIVDEPYGADVAYGGSPATTLLGGTSADLSSTGVTLLGRYRFSEAFSVHGGLRYAAVEADVTLSGLAYGLLSGYDVDLRDGSGTGYVLGAAYERPDIALRVALTYQSEIDLNFDSTETLDPGLPLPPGPTEGDTEVIAPESWNLDLQTGIAEGTLLFGQVRYAAYGDTLVSPAIFALATGGASITDIEDSYAYTVGIGRQLTANLAGSIAVRYEPEGEDDLVSPLSPTNGQTSIQLGTQYAMGSIVLSGGVQYTFLGDAQPETGTPDVARASFEDNDAVSVGLQVAYRF